MGEHILHASVVVCRAARQRRRGWDCKRLESGLNSSGSHDDCKPKQRSVLNASHMSNLRTPARSFSISCKRARALPPSGLANALRRGAPIDVHPEVEEALASSKPLVALETAIVTHGLPYPANRDVSLSLERIVRSTGCVPATIGLVDGRVKIGLDAPQLERLAENSSKPVKLSRRDIAAAIATKQHGGTTITSTLIFAAMAGIKVVATGGFERRYPCLSCVLIVHLCLDWEGFIVEARTVSIRPDSLCVSSQYLCLQAMDVSADLPELSRCPVALVSAGVKSILDIGRFVLHRHLNLLSG
jgi:pseudouridylate synthase / pseudouridine kinase